jgi:hypothetical protein
MGWSIIGLSVCFLALYFFSLWLAWIIAVWATEPKKADPAAGSG